MKKIFTFVLIMLVGICFSGCAEKAEAETSELSAKVEYGILEISGSGSVGKQHEYLWSNITEEIFGVAVVGDIKEIEDEAFSSLNLSQAYMYNVEKIGENAFGKDVRLDYMYIPKTVKYIDDNAFSVNNIAFGGTKAEAENILRKYYADGTKICIYGDLWRYALNENGEEELISEGFTKAIDSAIKKIQSDNYELYGQPTIAFPYSVSESEKYFFVDIHCTDVFLNPGWYEAFIVNKSNFRAVPFDAGNGNMNELKIKKAAEMGFETEEGYDGEMIKADYVFDLDKSFF